MEAYCKRCGTKFGADGRAFEVGTMPKGKEEVRDWFCFMCKIDEMSPEALKDFAERTADDDVEILVTAVLIQRQVGGNLSEILDTISNTIRERVKLKGDIRTMTAQSKLSALIVGAIPFFIVFILYAMNRDFMMPLFTTLLGNILLGIALVMQAIGIFILVKLLDLKV